MEDEELREIYKIASEERLQTLQAGLLHLEKHPDDEATLEQLLREAHTLKGDSRSAGLETVESLTHALEEILERIKHQQTILTPQVSDRLYQGLDTLGLLVHEAVTGQASGVDLVGAIEQLMEVVATAPIQESFPAADEQAIATTEEQSSPAESLAIATPDLPSSSPGVGEPYHIDTIRVPTHDLDSLLTQAEELTVTKIAIAHATTEIEAMATLWEEWRAVYSKGKSLNSSSLAANPYLERLEKTLHSLRTSSQENITKLDMISGELREKIRTLRLLPLSTLFQLFPRMVRDLARQQSKQVELIIEGGETTADKRILEEIKDSLMHMIRNAIDHGIETADERERLGKPPIAKIWLRGYQSGNSIIIEVADDGRGLDTEKIKQTAIKRKLYRAEELETMAPSQLHALIFAPGFSTRAFITEISGRGIGLDVVRTNVERLKGTIQIESTLGQGCTFRLQLSTTLAIVNALLLEVQGIIHALPIEFVHTSLLVSQDQILTKDGRETIIVDGQIVPVADLGELLELSNSPIYASVAKGNPQKSELRQTILLKVGEEQAGFFVDRLLDTQEVAIKPQSQVLKRVRNVSGATILPSGDVCTILNPPDLLRSLQQQTPSATSIKPKETVQKKPVILLVEDSIPVRTQEKRLLEGAGYEVVIAVDGLDGYNKLRSRDFDAVVSDVEMPNLNGFSLTAKIRKHPEYKNLPIILVTTLTSDADKSKGAKAGADAYIIKGKFNQDFLLETLGRLV
ncbi:MAG: hybrid sensor histidine kinase/response regulator [Coleofasciculus sp. S288]|nr:hybrid sensor histidine kinase/response regulator [Coleofasciculus sp. S288]